MGIILVQPKGKKPGSTIEIVALLVLFAVSIWIPKQQSLFSQDKIAEGQAESASYLNFASSTDLLMTSDKVVLPDAWSSTTDPDSMDLRVLKLRSKQVRFVQAVEKTNLVEMRQPATIENQWVVQSVKRLGMNGFVETLDVADIDGERTTPYVELGSGSNDFSVVYHLKSDKSRTQRKKIRLISSDASSSGAR